MSTTYQALLQYGCILGYDEVYQAVTAITDETARDRAWDTLNDYTIVVDQVDSPEQPFFFGHVLAGGDDSGIEVLNARELGSKLEGVGRYKTDVLQELLQTTDDNSQIRHPEFVAFSTWLYERVRTADDWALRLLPSFG